MRTLYLECNMGVAGDMLMGALLELHPDKESFIQRINQIGLPDVKVAAESSVKCGIIGTHVVVEINGKEEEHIHHHDHSHVHLGMNEINLIIDRLEIAESVKNDVKHIYKSIAEAESKVHGKPITEVHFHEVGMADAIADITGCMMLLHELQVERIITSPIHVGFGQVRCAHGILPVPAPATALLLEGIPCYAGEIEGELCTPTGAAIVKYITEEYQRMPPIIMKKIGYGMGKKEFAAANCVRAILGEMRENTDEIIEFYCNVDDMTPEETGYAMELLLEHGALDVFTTSIGMKKSRPGILLTVICKKAEREKIAELIFKHTSTIGLRESVCNRMVMRRTNRVLESQFGEILIKESSGYGITKEKMEYEDLKKIADQTGMSIRDIKKQIKEG